MRNFYPTNSPCLASQRDPGEEVMIEGMFKQATHKDFGNDQNLVIIVDRQIFLTKNVIAILESSSGPSRMQLLFRIF